MKNYRYVAVDTEGALIRPGLLAPPTVCVSFAERIRGKLITDLQKVERGVKDFETLLDDPTAILIFKNSPFDNAVLVNSAPHLMVKVFNAYAAGRIRDVGTRQELIDIYHGRISENGKTFVFDKGSWRPRDYSLAGLEKIYGVADRAVEKKDPNSWRYRFAELAHLPVKQWPKEAVDYAKEDAGGTLLVYEAQTAVVSRMKYTDPHAEDGTAVVNEIEQSKAQWALHLMSAWGIRTDGPSVEKLATELYKKRDAARRTLIRYGILRAKRATAQEVREEKVDFFEPHVKDRKATKAEVNGTQKLKSNQYVKDGRLYTEQSVPMRWAQDKKRVQELVAAYYRKEKKTVPMTAASTRHEKGQVATDKDTLQGVHSRLLKLIADGGGVEKIINTYLPVLRQGTEYPINVRYNVLVNSGRTSAYGQEDRFSFIKTGKQEQAGCNIQNLPTGRRVAGTRECFVARPGTFLCSVDYNTLELRALAQICFWLFGKSRMMEVLNSGKDLHLAMAADMLRIAYHEAEAVYKKKDVSEEVYGTLRPAIKETFKVDIAVGDAYAKRVEWAYKQIKRTRDCAKVANFGLPGGLGAASLVFFARATYGVIITEEYAAELKNEWLKSWPEMRLYFSHINQLVGHEKELAKVIQFWSGRVRGNMGYCDACNTLFQGLAADGAKLAMFRIAYEMYCVPSSPLYGSRLVAFIHDEFLAELKEERAHEAAERMTQLAIEEMKKVLPDVLVTSEPALMINWSKEAEKVVDAQGRLVPWRPKEKVA
jgi:hypothetical protein